MKYFIFILLIFLGTMAKAQLPSSTFMSRDFNGNTKADWIILDSPLVNFVGTSLFNARYAGTQFVKIGGGDTAFYFGAGGNLWFRSLLDRDTVSLSNRINLKLNISDTTSKWWGIGKRWVDTVYRVNDSTVGFTINEGAQQTFQILGRLPSGGGGSGTVTSVGISLPSAFNVTPSTITTSGTFAVTGAGTTSQYIRGNGTLATFDTGAISNFYLKVRGLLSGTSPITFSQITGAIGINNANNSGTKGAATFTGAFSDNGSGTIDLLTLGAAGSCTGCNLNIDAKGRITGYADGAGGATNNTNLGAGLRILNSATQGMRTLFAGFGTAIDSVANANGLTWSADTTRGSGLPTYFYADSLFNSFDVLVNSGLSKSGDTAQLGSINTTNNPLNHNTWINTAGFKLTVQGSTGSGNVFEAINLGSGTGVFGQSVSEYGVLGSSTSLYGVYGTSTTSNAIRGWTTNGNTAAYFEGTASSTNTVIPTVQIKRTTSGLAAAGIGSSIEYYVEKDNGANNTVSNSLRSLLTTATSGGEVSQFEIYGVNAATLARKAALAGNGQWTWDGYPALTPQIDTTTYKPVAIDGSGNVVKMSGWAGSGGSSITTQQSITGTSLINLVNDVDVPNKGYAYIAKVGYDTTRGWQELEENFLGNIYNANTWSSFSTGFTNTGSVTGDIVNSNLHFTGGTLYGNLALTTPYTSIDNYIITDTVVINEKSGTSYGSGIGTVSVNNSIPGSSDVPIFLRFIAYTGGGSGTLALTVGVAHTIAATSSALTFSAGDTLLRTFTRDGWSYTGSIRNLTTNSAPVTLSYTFTSSGDVMPNTGRFAIFFLGGEFTINSWSVTSNSNKNARLSLKVDSRGVGYTVSSQAARLGDLLNANFKNTIVSGGGFDRTTEALLTLPEDSLLKPQQTLICLGYNDLVTGTSLATTEANLDSIYNFYVAHNIDPYFLLVATVSPAMSTTALNAYLRSTYPTRVFDCEQLMLANGALAADGVHWTDYGNQLLYDFIVQSYRLYGGNTRYGGAGADISGTTNYFSMFTGPTSLGDAPQYQDGVRITQTLPLEQHTTNPDYVWYDTDGAANEKIFTAEVDGGAMNWRRVNDARSAAVTFMQFLSSGNDISLMRFLKPSRFEDGVILYNTPTGSSSDSVLVQELATGRVKRIAPISVSATIYNGDGTLAADRNVSSGGFTLRLSGANNSDTLMSIINSGTSSTGLFSSGTLFGIDALSTSIALRAFGTTQGIISTGDNSYGATIKSNSIAGLLVQSVPATTNTVQEVLRIERGVNGSPGANGVGGSADFFNKASDNSSNVSNQLISKWTDATVGTRTSQFSITGVNSASTGTVLTIDGNGAITTVGKRIIGTTTSSAGTLTLGNLEAYIFNGTTTTWTLPPVSGTTGTIYYIKNIGSGSITLNADGGNNEIYSSSAVNTITVTAGSAVILISNNTYWTVN